VTTKEYLCIKDYYELCLEKHGPNSVKSLDWKSNEEVLDRYDVMIDMFLDVNKKPSGFGRKSPIKLLDFGCGYGGLYKHLGLEGTSLSYLSKHDLIYTGVDISEKFISCCSNIVVAPHKAACLDILTSSEGLEKYDFVVCNGTFTVKRDLTKEQMTEFLIGCLKVLLCHTKDGLAFNIMDPNKVDYMREDLFFLSYDELAKICRSLDIKSYIIRADYGLKEYTVYLFQH
jgi:SAM-dependent methyltransferase